MVLNTMCNTNRKALKINELLDEDLDYNNAIFLTFDIDWASDEVLSHCLDVIEDSKINATFFVTHETSVLDRMRSSSHIELGIHPNFNFLLNGDFRYGKTFNEVLDYYLKMVPEAVSARSHSLVQGSQFLDAFKNRGIQLELNTYIPRNSNISLQPFKSWQEGLTRVPHFWEDDLHILYGDPWDVDYYLNFNGLKVFDFHPIHMFLNTEKLERYNNARSVLQNHKALLQHINSERTGTKNFFMNLIQAL